MKSTADFISDRSELAKLEEFTAQFAAAAGLSGKDLFALQVVVEELVTNVIEYGEVPVGQHAATVVIEKGADALTITITDCGKAYNPLLREDPDVTLPAEKRPIGGLGVHFCKKLTDSQHYARLDGQNVLTLTRKLNS